MVIRFFAHAISVVFHPLLLLTYMLLFLIWTNPYEFGGGGFSENMIGIIKVFLYTFALPAFCLLMMRALDLVSDISLPTKEDRIIPFIAAGVFYSWLAVNAYYTNVFPKVFIIFTIGSTISLFVAFFLNNFIKVSLHTTGAGGLVAMMLITLIYFSYENIDLFFLLTILVAGAVGTARLLLKAHKTKEIYLGYFSGILGQVAAFIIFF